MGGGEPRPKKDFCLPTLCCFHCLSAPVSAENGGAARVGELQGKHSRWGGRWFQDELIVAV